MLDVDKAGKAQTFNRSRLQAHLDQDSIQTLHCTGVHPLLRSNLHMLKGPIALRFLSGTEGGQAMAEW
jgi:hypothetical protein